MVQMKFCDFPHVGYEYAHGVTGCVLERVGGTNRSKDKNEKSSRIKKRRRRMARTLSQQAAQHPEALLNLENNAGKIWVQIKNYIPVSHEKR